MNQLITITETNGNKAVSARELYQYLEVTERFSKWFNRMTKYSLEENLDYQECTIWNALANQEVTDYALSIDTAKEISMLQRTEKGKQARRYFIAVEKQVTQPQSLHFSPKQQHWIRHYELIDAIRNNLVRGDVVDVAAQNGISRNVAENVMRGRTENSFIIRLLFERALQNKKTLGVNSQNMIDQLNSI